MKNKTFYIFIGTFYCLIQILLIIFTFKYTTLDTKIILCSLIIMTGIIYQSIFYLEDQLKNKNNEIIKKRRDKKTKLFIFKNENDRKCFVKKRIGEFKND